MVISTRKIVLLSKPPVINLPKTFPFNLDTKSKVVNDPPPPHTHTHIHTHSHRHTDTHTHTHTHTHTIPIYCSILIYTFLLYACYSMCTFSVWFSLTKEYFQYIPFFLSHEVSDMLWDTCSRSVHGYVIVRTNCIYIVFIYKIGRQCSNSENT